MELVALVRPPASPEEAARVLAQAAGVTMAEARMRLVREPPALLARLEAALAGALVAELRASGLAALAVELPCPSDRDRTVVHRFSLGDTWATFTPRAGEVLRFPWTEVAAVLRGVRTSRVERVHSEERTMVVPAPDLTPTVTTRKERVRSAQDASEQVVLVYLRDGRCALLSSEHLAFLCLGADMGPSATGNMAALAEQLRARTRHAFHDDRLLRLGRRALPFGVDLESQTVAGDAVTIRSSTSATLDVLAEVLRQAVAHGDLP